MKVQAGTNNICLFNNCLEKYLSKKRFQNI